MQAIAGIGAGLIDGCAGARVMEPVEMKLYAMEPEVAWQQEDRVRPGSPAGNTSTSVTFTLPRLIDDPVFASGCCATVAEDIITQGLTAWPCVEAAVIEQAMEQVIVFYDPAHTGLDTIRETLEAIDYPAVRVMQNRAGLGSASNR